MRVFALRIAAKTRDNIGFRREKYLDCKITMTNTQTSESSLLEQYGPREAMEYDVVIASNNWPLKKIAKYPFASWKKAASSVPTSCPVP